jgi:hypothetical protein
MRNNLIILGASPMTPKEREELLACSQRIAELFYKEVREQERSLSTLGEIEITVREQIQTHVAPVIGEFFAKPSVAQAKDTLER